MSTRLPGQEGLDIRGTVGWFPQTSWMLLEAAHGNGDKAAAALAEFTRRYYRPAYSYIAAIIQDPDEVEELTQQFFATTVVSGRLLSRVNRTKGSFRPYLKQALRNHVIDWRRKNERVRPLNMQPGAEGYDLGRIVDPSPTPDVAFHIAWVRTLLDAALTRVQKICEEKGQTEHLKLFVGRYLSELPAPPSWRELGTVFGLDKKVARSRAETVARRFRLVLREMLFAEVGSEQSADTEIAALLAFL